MLVDLATIPQLPAANPQITKRNETTLEHLHQIARGSLLHHHLKVGEYLLTTYFDGDAALYGDKRRNKEMGFDTLLSQHRDALTEMGLKPQLLRSCVRAQIVWRALPDNVRTALDFSGLLALAPLPDLQERGRLAAHAVSEKWTSRQIDEAVLLEKKVQRKHGKKHGRPPLPVAFKRASQLIRAGTGLPTQVNQLKHLSDSQREELHQGAVHLVAKLQKLIAALAAPIVPSPPSV